MKSAGILLPIFSLPSKYGIGCFSEEAFDFIDFLVDSGQKYWQILPLVPAGSWDSPYASCSTFAGNPYFIDLEHLVNLTLLSIEEIESYDWGDDKQFVDYNKVYKNKDELLKLAYSRNNLKHNYLYAKFCNEQKLWLDGYVNYMSEKNGDEPDYYRFQQFLFHLQWDFIKSYANYRGIEIIGDLPIYVSLDSSDVHDNPELFQLDENGNPVAVAGCPPDAFSKDGQRWGNPLYDWDKHKETNYKWWVERIRHCFELYDVVRIDHFRAMYDYYSIPYEDDSAKYGCWKFGPGMDLFNAVKNELGDVNIIAEDLGYLTQGVHDLLKETGFPGMKILHFAFNGGDDNPYLPENLGTDNCIVYPGTHDNNTTMGWYNEASEHEKEHFGIYIDNDNVCWGMIELAMSTRANICIIPMQDYLELGAECRTNTPGTVGNNWKWRMTEIPSKELAEKIKGVVKRYNR